MEHSIGPGIDRLSPCVTFTF